MSSTPREPPPGAPVGRTPSLHTAGSAPDEDVHLLDRLAIIYRYRAIAATVFVLTTFAVFIQGYSSIQLFEAHAQLLIEDERSAAVPGLTTTKMRLRGSRTVRHNTQ